MSDKSSRFEDIEESIKRWSRGIVYIVIGAVVTLILENWNIIVLQLSVETIGFAIIGIGLSIAIGYIRAIGSDIVYLNKEVKQGFDRVVLAIERFTHGNPKSPQSNPHFEDEEEEEIRTSGAGALAGMIAGGAIGLLGGPVGVIIGGVIGALLGNEIEREEEKEKKKRRHLQLQK